MIYNDLLVSVTNSQGQPLEEFKQAEIGQNSVECWIPSNEGSGFQIHFQAIRNFKPKLGLCSGIKLDGKGVSGGTLSPSSISHGLPRIKTGMTVARGLKRHYIFGRHKVTDRDDVALPDASVQELMGTIQVTLSWVKYGKVQRRYNPYRNPEEPGFVHERAVKKGHLGAATLGAPVRTIPISGQHSRDKKDAGFPKVTFLFRYGPRDWLEAKDIIPTEHHPATQTSNPNIPSGVVKKERKATTHSIPETLRSHSGAIPQKQSESQLDVIDIDELESDNDSDIIILSDPVVPKGSTSRIKAGT
ncbi:unnamed protein product [Rhizoctonia solani]|uniref:DUF7918 domain-containing protein n=1 Tax=Rhizoctonia solani TaxID=456999 RepID=A0A8H3HMW5_9AGAM|nr:unnamed protein product [Rhizoctonia solani]